MTARAPDVGEMGRYGEIALVSSPRISGHAESSVCGGGTAEGRMAVAVGLLRVGGARVCNGCNGCNGGAMVLGQASSTSS